MNNIRTTFLFPLLLYILCAITQRAEAQKDTVIIYDADQKMVEIYVDTSGNMQNLKDLDFSLLVKEIEKKYKNNISFEEEPQEVVVEVFGEDGAVVETKKSLTRPLLTKIEINDGSGTMIIRVPEGVDPELREEIFEEIEEEMEEMEEELQEAMEELEEELEGDEINISINGFDYSSYAIGKQSVKWAIKRTENDIKELEAQLDTTYVPSKKATLQRQLANEQEKLKELNHTLENSDSLRAEREKIKLERIRRSNSRFKYRGSQMDVGLNNFIEDGAIPSGNTPPYVVRAGGSRSFSISFMWGRHYGKQGKHALYFTPSVNFYNFKFEEPFLLNDDSDTIQFVRSEEANKTKLVNTQIRLPIQYMYRIGRTRLQLAPYLGYTVNSYVTEWIDGDKDRTHSHYNINPVSYGVTAAFMHKRLGIFADLQLSPLFSGSENPQLLPFSVGARWWWIQS